MAQHHIPSEWLTAYAAGAVDDAMAALIAAHLSYCPKCRADLADLEMLGGMMIDAIDPQTADEAVLPPSLDVLQAEESAAAALSRAMAPTASAPSLDGSVEQMMPASLAELIYECTGRDQFEKLPWRPYAPGVQRVKLPTRKAGAIARLIKAQPGSSFPHHNHGSDEMTIILQGAYRDGDTVYSVGDVQCIGENQPHQPIIAGDEICVGFVVSDTQPIPTGMVAKFVQWVIG